LPFNPNPTRNPYAAELLELYGALTGNSIRAAIVLIEAGIAFTPRRVNLASGALRHPEYLVLNPAGKVPTLVDHSYSPALVISNNSVRRQQSARATLAYHFRCRALEGLRSFSIFVTDMIAPSHAAFFSNRSGNQIGELRSMNGLWRLCKLLKLFSNKTTSQELHSR
jgi:GST-like protein